MPRVTDVMEKASTSVARCIFSPISAVFHTLWFTVWLIAGLDINLLTMIVSLEAIYVTLLVGLAANLEEKRDKIAQKQRDTLQETMEAHIERMEQAMASHGKQVRVRNGNKK